MPLVGRAISDFIYNCGHSANFVRPTSRSMRQTHDHFAYLINSHLQPGTNSSAKEQHFQVGCRLNVVIPIRDQATGSLFSGLTGLKFFAHAQNRGSSQLSDPAITG
jgi:hypothetical protein